jgi:hypothetical protein
MVAAMLLMSFLLFDDYAPEGAFIRTTSQFRIIDSGQKKGRIFNDAANPQSPHL